MTFAYICLRRRVIQVDLCITDRRSPGAKEQAYSGTLTRREIVRANASLGELRRDKEKLNSPISCEFVRVKAS